MKMITMMKYILVHNGNRNHGQHQQFLQCFKPTHPKEKGNVARKGRGG